MWEDVRKKDEQKEHVSFVSRGVQLCDSERKLDVQFY